MLPHHSHACKSWLGGAGGVIPAEWVQEAKAGTGLSSKDELCCMRRYLFCCFYRAVGTAAFAGVFVWQNGGEGTCVCECVTFTLIIPTPTYPHTHTEAFIISIHKPIKRVFYRLSFLLNRGPQSTL